MNNNEITIKVKGDDNNVSNTIIQAENIHYTTLHTNATFESLEETILNTHPADWKRNNDIWFLASNMSIYIKTEDREGEWRDHYLFKGKIDPCLYDPNIWAEKAIIYYNDRPFYEFLSFVLDGGRVVIPYPVPIKSSNDEKHTHFIESHIQLHICCLLMRNYAYSNESTFQREHESILLWLKKLDIEVKCS